MSNPSLASPVSARRPADIADIAVPVVLMLAGMALRYLAYAWVYEGPSPAGFVRSLCVWDCYWFSDIAQHGYQAYPEQVNFGGPAGIANWAFFPLYPALAAVIGRLTSLAPDIVGTLVSPLLTLAAVMVSRPLFRENRGAFLLFAVFLLAGPFSFYFSTLYSESLFVLLTVLAFVLLEDGRYVGAGVAGALLSATRVTGVLFVLPLVIEAYRQHRRDGGTRIGFLTALPGRPDLVLGVVLVPAGVVAFMAWLYWTTGDALAFAHIQRGWDRVLGNPIAFLLAGLDPRQSNWLSDIQMMAFATLGGFGLVAVLLVQRRMGMAVFCLAAMLLSLSAGLTSMPRFIAGLAPLWIALATVLARYRLLLIIAVLACLALDFRLTVLWLHQQRALM
jgi:hypothetical protein